jgi:uncharacterized protein YndB with AHSA1/START domain
MKTDQIDTAEFGDTSCKEINGKTPKQWFDHLDGQGGVAKGRREPVNDLYSEQKLDEWWATNLALEYEKARSAVEKDGKPKGYSICSTKTVTTPLDEVFGAFGDAKILERWLGPKVKVEFKDGGRFETADGDRGSFTKIRAGKDLRFTWENPKLAPGTQVEDLFADKGKGKTGITLNRTRIQDRRDADRIRAGWGAAFEALKSHLEGGT